MKRAIFFIGIMIFSSSLVLSQGYEGKARIQGKVTDEEGKPLEGVKVKLYCVKAESGFETETDNKGRWKGSWIRGGSWHIDFEKAGYAPKNISTEVSELRQNPLIEVKMKEAEGLVVAGELKEDFEKGNMLYGEGKYEEAIEVFKRMIEAFPDAYIINMNIFYSFHLNEFIVAFSTNNSDNNPAHIFSAYLHQIVSTKQIKPDFPCFLFKERTLQNFKISVFLSRYS